MYGGYHCAVNRVSIRRLWMLWVPHVSGLHVGSSVGAHAQESETLLRPRRSALRDLQLLPKAAVAENASRAKLVCARAGSDSRTVQVFAGGLCGYARSRAHLLISEPPKSTPSLMLKALKQRVSRDLRRKKRQVASGQLRLPFLTEVLELPRFWQTRFYDFNVYSSRKLREKLEYMHANPVKRGLVKNPGAWMWSSFLFYEKGQPGLVEIDPVG